MTGRADGDLAAVDHLVPVAVRHELREREWGHQHVVHAGPADVPEAPVLVLVHGWPQHWLAWRLVLPHLVTDHHVVVVDLRGMGWSGGSARGSTPTLDDLAGDVLDLAAEVAAERAGSRVALVGHDWGGWLAFLAAQRRPALVDRVVGLAITPPWLDRRAVVRRAPVLSYTVALALAGRALARRGTLVREGLRRSAHHDPWRDAEGRAVLDTYVERLARPSAGATTEALYGGLLRRDAWRAMGPRGARLPQPGAIVVGEHEPITTPDLFWSRTDPDELEVVVVPDAGHWLLEEQPDATAARLRALLGSGAQVDLEVTGEGPVHQP